MAEALATSVTRDAGGCTVQIFVHDPDLVGKSGELTVELNAKVKRSSPVHRREVLGKHRFTLAPGQNRVALGHVLKDVFSYRGHQLDLEPVAKIRIDDGIIFDTELTVDLSGACRLPPRADVPVDHASVHSPRDRFNFFANLRAIPAKARLIVLWLIAIGLPLMLINAAVGARDQFVPESQVWFYDHTGDDGSESPLLKALGGSGTLGMMLWLAIRAQLRKYMTFDARLTVREIGRGVRCAASDMIGGSARVPLRQALVRVVAYNCEHGQYRTTEGSGKNKRTVTRTFANDARGIVLYEQALVEVPAGAPISGQLAGEVDFSPIFDRLYPPCRYGGTHGLSIRIEAQLLHPDYVDHDVVLQPDRIIRGHFLGS